MVIYEIINEHNKKYNIRPWRYIGSDSKDRDNYMGSSKHLSADIKRLGIHNFSKHTLWKGSQDDLANMGHTRLTGLERQFHVQYNVIASPEFYNKVFADEQFTTECVGNFYYVNDPHKKLLLLPVNHPDVISGLAVGQHYGKTRTHTNERNSKISSSLKQRYLTHKHHRLGDKLSDDIKLKMSKPKSEQHKQNIKRAVNERLKDPLYRQKLSANNGRRTPVLQFTLEGELIAIYDTIKDAAASVGGGNKRADISACCRGVQKSAHGFIWKYQSTTHTDSSNGHSRAT